MESGEPPRNDSRTVKVDGSVTQICQVLRRLLEQHCLLTVQIGSAPECFTSAILEVVRNGEFLVLDELTPHAGHLRLRDDRQIQVRGILDGLAVRFASKVAQISAKNELPYYKVPFPIRIDYPQRREVHRIPAPLYTGFPVSLLMADGRIVSGELRDISPAGLGLRVRTRTIDIKADLNTIAICHVSLQPPSEFVADIQICHLDPPVRDRLPRLGARFIGLQPGQIRRVEQLCAEFAREQRRER